ncbi:hypothetical protein B0O99DRAFT_694861 [Bisporella sp. PMI_857]|nr:hypothetical protein B0O99DRAFT_694861 [Bisporella sp. PMI_857]
MFGRSRSSYFVSFLALLGPAVAANLYRIDFRSPAEVQAAGGLVSRDPKGTGSVIDHVKATLGNRDGLRYIKWVPYPYPQVYNQLGVMHASQCVPAHYVH